MIDVIKREELLAMNYQETCFLLLNLREFVNYRHPDPRRVWKGESEPQLMTPDPRDPLDPLDPRMNSFSLQVDGRNGTW